MLLDSFMIFLKSFDFISFFPSDTLKHIRAKTLLKDICSQARKGRTDVGSGSILSRFITVNGM